MDTSARTKRVIARVVGALTLVGVLVSCPVMACVLLAVAPNGQVVVRNVSGVTLCDVNLAPAFLNPTPRTLEVGVSVTYPVHFDGEASNPVVFYRYCDDSQLRHKALSDDFYLAEFDRYGVLIGPPGSLVQVRRE